MSDPRPEAPTRLTRRQRVASVVWWILAGAVYATLGMLVPWVFLLGFWQSAVFVAIVTALAPRVARRFA